MPQWESSLIQRMSVITELYAISYIYKYQQHLSLRSIRTINFLVWPIHVFLIFPILLQVKTIFFWRGLEHKLFLVDKYTKYLCSNKFRSLMHKTYLPRIKISTTSTNENVTHLYKKAHIFSRSFQKKVKFFIWHNITKNGSKSCVPNFQINNGRGWD